VFFESKYSVSVNNIDRQTNKMAVTVLQSGVHEGNH